MEDLSEKIAFQTVEEIRNLQERKLQELVKYVYHNSKYYRQIFDNRSITPEDITCSLPTHQLK